MDASMDNKRKELLEKIRKQFREKKYIEARSDQIIRPIHSLTRSFRKFWNNPRKYIILKLAKNGFNCFKLDKK